MTLSQRVTIEGDVLPELTLRECPIGLFYCGTQLCVRIEGESGKGHAMAFIVESGEFFWGDGPDTVESQLKQRVRPVEITKTR